MRRSSNSLGHRDNIRAVDHLRGVLTEGGELEHGSLERALELGLVADERLPLASSASVTGELRVGLKTDFTLERRLDFTLVATGSRERGTAELSLDEELGVEHTRGGVEGSSGDGRVDEVGGSDGVGGKEGDNLSGAEPSVAEASKDTINAVKWLRDQKIRRGLSGRGTTEEEAETRSTRAVGNTDGTSELDEIPSGDVVRGDEGLLGIDNIINTTVGVEAGLSGVEGDDGAICTSTTELASLGQSGREADGVVEGQTERLVDFFTALSAVEEVGLDVIPNSEQRAAGRVVGGVLAIGASNPANESRVRDRDHGEEGEGLEGHC